MSRKNSKRMTIDDLLPGRSDDSFVIGQTKSGKPKVVRTKKRKTVPKPYFKQYPTFFRLINGNPGIPDPVEEFRFHPVRKWRVDICWPEQKLALEIEGGVWIGGGHVRPSGFVKDIEKYNALSIAGFHLLRFTPEQMETCEAYDILREWFKNNT